MAIINKKGFVSGLVGNVVFRESEGKQVVQTRPPGGKQARRKQTEETKLSGKEFGLASSAGAEVRRFMQSVYFGADSRLDSRLTGAIRAALRGSSTLAAGQRDLHDADLSVLEGFEFNVNSPLSRVLPGFPQVHFEPDDLFEVEVPSFDGDKIFHYPNTSLIRELDVTLNIVIFAFNFRMGFSQLIECYLLPVTRGRNSGEVLKCDKVLPAGSLVLTLASLHYHRSVGSGKNYIINSKNFSPSAIISAFHVPSNYLEHKASSLSLKEPVLQPSKMYRYKGNSILEQIRNKRNGDKDALT
ncbi:hypothetical protein [Arcticibacter sp. MXS-1]|uniref:hypothetical protein n=1 Tax=Arcticibacter sp. MXS-1 TaxID=3341726 RepID=UPI0035A861B7